MRGRQAEGGMTGTGAVNIMESDELVLVAEDNPDDALLLRRAIERAGIKARIRFMQDGEEMLLYLQGLGAYANRAANPPPSLIILDLKMPRKSGLEVLAWLSEHPECSVVPTVVMSSSNLLKDIQSAYALGANTYFVKPTTFEALVETMKTLSTYWQRAERVRVQDGENIVSKRAAAL